MLVTIAYRHNYGRILINKYGNPTRRTKNISGQSIACIVDGEERMITFGGIVKAHRASRFKEIALVRIEAYSFDETGIFNFVELPKGIYLKGVLYEDKAYMVVDEECLPCSV
ncbi:hypothetical protein [Pseudoalteromonas sp. S16_S37]|uniref:hypothetical protein n=1 Tax=Pseudoalteromonas sp. S16_S37 TaxID=2720228 RepID=UPI0016815E15|nr:hypothetical protein [Pseudoalteromonas sp. S16_S37]MBD1584680.1 hypothetical protein [Pseudoalteromonas sp. S16_S37]